jgi:hypothetical protein
VTSSWSSSGKQSNCVKEIFSPLNLISSLRDLIEASFMIDVILVCMKCPPSSFLVLLGSIKKITRGLPHLYSTISENQDLIIGEINYQNSTFGFD